MPKVTKIQCPNSEILSLTQFVLRFLGNPKAFEVTPYPHLLVDTPQKFKSFCHEHQLKGYKRVAVELRPTTS